MFTPNNNNSFIWPQESSMSAKDNETSEANTSFRLKPEPATLETIQVRRKICFQVFLKS